jgi:signal transduction histidine kinase
MVFFEATADFDAAVMEAGDHFVTQVQPVIHPQSLSVILLDLEGDAGRVAFTWGHPHQFGISQSASLAHAPSYIDVSEQSIRISLEGREGALGAVLFRGDFPYGYNHEQPLLLRSITEQLALTLENIQLKECLRRKSAEARVHDNIASLIADNLPPGPTCRLFAAEVKRLIGFERITFFLGDDRSRDLSRVFQFGIGTGNSESSAIGHSYGAAWKDAVSCGEGVVIQDRAQLGSADSPNLEDSTGMRSALIAPISYGGEVVGVVMPESRWPNVYGQAELTLVSRAAALLGPWVANSQLNSRLERNANELAAIDGVGRAARCSNGLEPAFGYMAEALNGSIPFECATVTWIELDGSDVSALHWSGDAASAIFPSSIDDRRLETRLVLGRQEIGALTLTRGSGLEFTEEDSRTLDRFALQLAPIVQDIRLSRQGERQANQIQRLVRQGQTHDPATQGGGAYLEMSSEAVRALRNPLTAIKGYSSALLQPDVTWPPEMSREFLESIDRETDRLNQAVSQLLPSVEDKPDLEGLTLQNTSIEALFDKVQADLGLVDWSKPVEFHCEPGLPLALVNHSRLVQALCHLIRCAAQWTPQEVVIQVEACWRQGHPAVVIGSINQSRPGDAWLTEQQQPGGDTYRPDRSCLVKDFQVVVARNLLDAHGVRLRILPPGRENEIFWFPMPHE